jgi:glutathione S-transferase
MNRFSCLTGIPDSTKGLVRELRVRWMLEELGLPYEEVRYPHPEIKKDPYLQKQPFGQVPYFESEDITMFETGAILLHLAMKHKKLLPQDEIKRAHVFTWMFAALTSIEPWLWHHFMLRIDPDAAESSKARARELVEGRLLALSNQLGTKEFFGEEFSIADIIMTTVLKTASRLGTMENYDNLFRYLQRNEARPAFQRAMSDHVKLYEENK